MSKNEETCALSLNATFSEKFRLLLETMLSAQIDRYPHLQNLEIVRANYINHEFPRHMHESYVIEVVVQGTVELECAGKKYFVTKGNILLINPGEVHNGCSANGREVEYWSFCPTQDWMDWFLQFIDYEEAPIFRSSTIEDVKLANLLKRAHETLRNKKEILLSESLLTTAFSELLSRNSAALSKNTCSEPKAIQKVKQYLQEEFSQQIRLAELSQMIGLSPFYFLRAFRKATGLSPHEYLCNVRVEKARKLLAKGVSIVESAAQTGFFDQSHLHRHFRRILGITPGQYRVMKMRSFC